MIKVITEAPDRYGFATDDEIRDKYVKRADHDIHWQHKYRKQRDDLIAEINRNIIPKCNELFELFDECRAHSDRYVPETHISFSRPSSLGFDNNGRVLNYRYDYSGNVFIDREGGVRVTVDSRYSGLPDYLCDGRDGDKVIFLGKFVNDFDRLYEELKQNLLEQE